MSLFRGPLRLVDDPANVSTVLGTALHDWAAERGDALAIARLEQQLAAALAKPRSALPRAAPLAPPGPACLLGLWAVNAAIALLLSWHEAPRQLAAVAPRPAGLSALEVASRLGVGPRELAVREAMDPFHVTHWR